MDDRRSLELDRARSVVAAARHVLSATPATLQDAILILEMTIKTYDAVPPPRITEAMQELREAVGGQYDGVDAIAFVRELREGT